MQLLIRAKKNRKYVFFKGGGGFLFHNHCCFNKKQPGLSVKPTSLSGEWDPFEWQRTPLEEKREGR